jgi:uncharacterized protein YdhG (YjbR/CyaY superfamily)
MAATSPAPATIDEYISGFSPEVQRVLQRIRKTIRSAAPDAQEIISYRMPAFKVNGVLVYFAAFKHHIGLYPPVKGDARLEKAVLPYAGEKGNLRFPLDLIERIAKLRAAQDAAKADAARKRRRS